MSAEMFKYLLTGAFVLLTFYLSWKGMKKTNDIKSFAIGNKDMNPYLIGITMAASISSTATFVINPGFVYAHGLSAWVHYGIAASLGILSAFLILSHAFRKQGETMGALTIPDWVYHRFGSRGLSLFFAGMNLVSITFVVLILVGCSILMSSLFPIPQKTSLIIILLFVFSYVLMGGTYAHAYTNTFQGILMLLISVFLFGHGLKYFEGGFIGSLESISSNYAMLFNPESSLYYDSMSVFISGFVITFALMLQPHILTKIFYLKNDGDVNKFIGTTTIVGICFSLMLFIGFYAKLSGLVVARQDTVVVEYITREFTTSAMGGYFLTFVSLALLAAGMSTLDGILVALSSMVVKDIYLPFAGKQPDNQKALWLSRVVLIVIGLVSFALAWNPPELVGLFAQKGVYALAAASLVPVLFGVLGNKQWPVWLMTMTAMTGFFGHLFLNSWGGIANPAVSSTYAIGMTFMWPFAFLLVERLAMQKSRQSAA